MASRDVQGVLFTLNVSSKYVASQWPHKDYGLDLFFSTVVEFPLLVGMFDSYWITSAFSQVLCARSLVFLVSIRLVL